MAKEQHYLQRELYELLRNEPAIFEFLQEGSLDGLWYWDLDNPEHEWMNEKFWKTLGYDPATKRHLISEWQEIIHPEDLQQAIVNAKEHFENQAKNYDQVVRYRRQDGSTAWIRCRGLAIRNQEGKPVRMLGAHTDISDQMNRTEELETFLNIALDLMCVVDSAGKFIKVNPSWTKTLGYPVDDLQKSNLVDLVYDDDQQKLRDTLLNIGPEKVKVVTARMKSINADPRFFDWRFSKRGSQIYGVARDVTDQIEIQKNLEEKDKQLEFFFNNSLEGFFFMMLDSPIKWNDQVDKEKLLDFVFEHQRITKINDAMLLQYKTDRTSFLGRTPSFFFRHNLPYGRHLWRELFDKGRLHVDTEERNFEGNTIWIEGDYICLYDDQGRITGHFGVQRDITQRRQMENMLIDEKAKAEAASRTKSEFLANITHEIRTPLNGIIGFAELLKKSELNNIQEKYLQSIRQSSNALLELIDDVLDFSKIEAGKLELDVGEVDLRALVEQVIDPFRPKSVSRNLELSVLVDSSVGEKFAADAIKIKQVLSNLLSNAVKFTELGKIELKLDVTGSDNTNGTQKILFSVADTGIGISPQKEKVIFEAFSQGDASITRKYGGTGLGLSISNKLLELMQSRLELESELDKGSRFFFELELPLLANDSIITTNQGSLPVQDRVSEEWGLQDSEFRILIAEDNPINSLLIQTLIDDILPSAQILLAEDGQAAIEMWKEHLPDLILMDIQMPFKSGYDATYEIRRGEKNQNLCEVPIIAVTAGILKADAQNFLKAGMNDYISKPVKLEEMEKMIKKWLYKPKYSPI